MTARVDYNELVDGYLSEKDIRILRRREKKEAAEFEATCMRLYKRNKAREKRAEDPEAANAKLRKWRKQNRERLSDLARQRRVEKHARRVCVCRVCGKRWNPPRQKARFCSTTCRNKYHTPAYVKRKRERRRAAGVPQRSMQLRPALLGVLRVEPWLTLPELVERLSGANPRSLAVTLCIMLKTGALIDDGRKKWRRYALPAAARRSVRPGNRTGEQ